MNSDHECGDDTNNNCYLPSTCPELGIGLRALNFFNFIKKKWREKPEHGVSLECEAWGAVLSHKGDMPRLCVHTCVPAAPQRSGGRAVLPDCAGSGSPQG